jgi:hypothetical protein
MGKKRYEIRQMESQSQTDVFDNEVREDKKESEVKVETDVVENKKEDNENPETLLGIKITEEDIDEYLFKGYITKEIVVIPNKFVITLRSLSSKDLTEINLKFENAIHRETEEKKILMSERANHYRSLLLLSHALRAVNGENIGNNPDARFEYLSNLGQVLFNRIIRDHNLLTVAIERKISDAKILKNV